MYIQKIEVENIRSIEKLTWEITDTNLLAGWHVIIGDNGTGKSTLLRAISMALVGPDHIRALRLDLKDWLRKNTKTGSIQLFITSDARYDSHSEKGKPKKDNLAPFGIKLERNEDKVQAIPIFAVNTKKNARDNPETHVWSEKNNGWFSAAYGPFRRFAGGDLRQENAYAAFPKLGAHLSVFGEDVALSEGVNWLLDLHYRKLSGKPEGSLLDPLISFINQDDFLPYGVRFQKVDPDGVIFSDANKHAIQVQTLGDGYRSILSMTFELIRQLERVYGAGTIFKDDPTKILLPGVVLIDEIDAHLHPTWQRRIGAWFRKHFPNIQFIVTTHSPLVCQSVDDLGTHQDEDTGTVFRLPVPGSGDTGQMVTEIDLQRLRYGTGLDAYGTEVFGSGVTRSEKGKQLVEKLRHLNIKELDKGLSHEEEEKQKILRAILPTGIYTS